MFRLFKRPQRAPAKPSLDHVALDLHTIPGALSVADGLPRVDWAKVRAAAAPFANDPAIDAIWTELAAQWLGALRRHLGGPYRLYEGRHLLLLSPAPPDVAGELLRFGDQAYDALDGLVERSPHERGFGKHAVLVFAPVATYYDYIHPLYPDADKPYGGSGGVMIGDGYRHTVINGIYASHTILAHELAHAMVSARPLPLWLNEGLAQMAESLARNRPGAIEMTARQGRAHRRCWGRGRIQQFWAGQTFHPATSQRASYQLAQVLFHNLLAAPARRQGVAALLKTADDKDAGAAACRACCGLTLGELAAEFLGPGDWEPAAHFESAGAAPDA